MLVWTVINNAKKKRESICVITSDASQLSTVCPCQTECIQARHYSNSTTSATSDVAIPKQNEAPSNFRSICYFKNLKGSKLN